MPSEPPSHSSRSSSVSPTRHGHPSEVTSLLPPSSSRPTTPNQASKKHDRKTSISARSVSGRSMAGSVRHYGAVNTKPGPVQQPARVSKVGQRRILTTLPIQLAFFLLVALTFLSLILTLLLFLNTAMDFSSLTPPYRGSGFFEFWLSAVGSWIGLGGVLFHSHPSYLYFLTSLITFVLHIPIILLLFLSPPLRSAHLPLGVVPLGLTALTVIFALLSNYLVRRAKRREGERICRMLTDAAGRERGVGEEGTARALVGIQGKGIWGGFVSFISGIVGLIAGLAGVVLVTLLLIDLSITAYDHGIALPSIHSRLVSVHPKNTPWATQSLTRKPKTLPTVLYEPPSGVPGSLALLSTPLPPAGESAENPGRWILDLQAAGKVGRVCVWDRPGYGFSEVMSTADLGDVADALWAALSAANEAKSSFALIGEGYGGLVSRVFASRHPKSIHSLLHIEAQTAQTYFNESPRGLSPISLLTHRIATRLLPSLITPLSLTRLPSILLRRSDSLSRILASTHPLPSTERLNENLRKARLQETWGSHSHTSASFRALLGSGQNYPRDAPAIVISSQERMKGDETWAEGQRGLAEEVTGEDGLVEWLKVDGDTKWVCEAEGRVVCEDSLRKLLGT